LLAQTIGNLFDCDMSLQAAVDAPRWQSESRGCVELESPFAEAVSSFLTENGYEVKVRGRGSSRSEA